MGGTKQADTIDNLMALCREHHMEFGDKKQHKQYLYNTHEFYIELRKRGKL
jgi:predicted restriction endonuclease